MSGMSSSDETSDAIHSRSSIAISAVVEGRKEKPIMMPSMLQGLNIPQYISIMVAIFYNSLGCAVEVLLGRFIFRSPAK